MAHSYSTFIHVKTTKSETIVMLIYTIDRVTVELLSKVNC